MVYCDQEKGTTCLVYDQAFTVRALSAGDDIVVVRLGRMHEDIYQRYQIAKLGDPRKIPPIPEEIVIGYLVPDEEGFELKSIFLEGWDCRPAYEAAMAIRGFPTEAYNTIYFLENYGDEYRRHLVEELMKEHGMQEDKRQQLLDYNPSGE